METIYFKGIECHTFGSIPQVGTVAPCFHLTSIDLKEVSCSDFPGNRIVLNIFPSLDTDVCAASVRRFNKEAAALKDVKVVCVSMDLPFAMSRFCTINGLENVIPASAFRSPLFCSNYHVEIIDGPLAGLLARAVIVIDTDGKVLYRELVREITSEPDYEGAISVLK